MKRKVIRKRTITIIPIGKRNSVMKLRVDNDIRFIELANQLSIKLDLDYIDTLWSFYPAEPFEQPIPLTFTLRQIELSLGKIDTFYAKLESIVNDDDVQIKVKVENVKEKVFEKISNLGFKGKKNEKYRLIAQKKKTKREIATSVEIGEVEARLKEIPKKEIFEGLSLIMICTKINCIKTYNPIIYSLGFGKFTKSQILNFSNCFSCPNHEALNPKMKLVGFIIRDGIWVFNNIYEESDGKSLHFEKKDIFDKKILKKNAGKVLRRVRKEEEFYKKVSSLRGRERKRAKGMRFIKEVKGIGRFVVDQSVFDWGNGIGVDFDIKECPVDVDLRLWRSDFI